MSATSCSDDTPRLVESPVHLKDPARGIGLARAARELVAEHFDSRIVLTRFDRAWKRGTRPSLSWWFMGLVSGGANRFLPAPHGGQKFCLSLHRAQVAQGGVFAVSIVEDFNVIENIGAHLGFVGKDVLTHR